MLIPQSKEPKLIPIPDTECNDNVRNYFDDAFEDGDAERMSETDDEKIANREYIILDALLSYIDSAVSICFI